MASCDSPKSTEYTDRIYDMFEKIDRSFDSVITDLDYVCEHKSDKILDEFVAKYAKYMNNVESFAKSVQINKVNKDDVDDVNKHLKVLLEIVELTRNV